MIVKDFDDMRIGTIPLSKLYYGHDLIWKRKDGYGNILIIKTTNVNTFTVPVINTLSITGTIDWGDGQTDGYNNHPITHNYSNLKSWTIKINAPIKILGDFAFNDYSSLTSITIPNSVTSIGLGAFYGCTSLTSIIIPDSVISIGNWAFDGCSSLASITIPDSVISIGSYTFDECTSLTSIIIPDSVASIGNYAFRNCTSLTSIIIPDSITSIKGYTFDGCSSLVSITIPISVKSIGSHVFRNTGLISVTIAADCRYEANSFPPNCVINRY